MLQPNAHDALDAHDASQRPVRLTRFGDIEQVTRPWHPALRPFVCGYTGYRTPPTTPYRVRLLPSGRAVLLINVGEPFARLGRLSGEGTTSGEGPIGSVVAGLEDGPGISEHPGGQEAILVELTPLGAYRLFGVPMHELTNQVAAVTDVLGPGAAELVERLALTPSWARRFDVLDAALLRRIEDGPLPAPEVARAWQLLVDTAGAVPIARITEDVGWSQKHLIRRFTQQVGLTPKTSARVLRFQSAVRMLGTGRVTPVEAAAACGYFDQAHMNREFRDLAANTPGRMVPSRNVEGIIAVL